MRYILVTIFIINSLSSYCQKVTENKIDEFTKHAVKRTSWETVMEKWTKTIYTRVSKIDSTEWLDVKIMLGGKVFAMGEGETLMIKLSNDSIVSLKSTEHKVSCKGCGAKGFAGSAAYGIEVNYVIEKEIHDILKKNTMVKIRIYTTDGYVEEEVSDKKNATIQALLKLIE